MSNIQSSNFRLPSSWLALGCITLLQAITASGSIFSCSSSLMKHHYHISHVQLSILIVASETGKLFICFSTSAANYVPAWMILFIGLIFGSIGYGVQYFYIVYRFPSLTYWQVLLLHALAGNSTCWINTYCHLLATRNFKDSHRTILAKTSSYSLLGGKVYTSLVEGIQGKELGPQNSHIYLLLACVAPPAVGLTTELININLNFIKYGDIMDVFPVVFVIAVATGAYAVIESVAPGLIHMSSKLRTVILVPVLMLPFAIAILMAENQFSIEKSLSDIISKGSKDFCESKPKRVTKELKISIDREKESVGDKAEDQEVEGNKKEHDLKELLMNVDFWLFYIVNACGATLGTVYLNNLERISESRGESSFLYAISSTFAFFGRIFSIMFNWYTREKPMIPNPALTVLLMMPMPVAFFVLMDSDRCIYISTGILGTCSGALNATSALITSELFSCKNFVVKQTIVLTNIPLGFLLLGGFAALNYEKESSRNLGTCLGPQCYYKTFIFWGSICFIGTILSFLLHLRTHNFYSQKS